MRAHSVRLDNGVESQVKGGFQTRPLVALLLLALAVRLALLLLAGLNAPLSGDELQYHQIALNVAEGKGFVENNNPFFPGQTLLAWQAPLYPLSLSFLYAIFGPQPLVGRLFGIALSVITVYLVYDLTRRLFSLRTARLSAFFVAIYPGLLTNAHLLLSETLFIFSMVLAFDILARALQNRGETGALRQMLLVLSAGFAWGAAALGRGLALYFAVPLALWLFWFLVRAEGVRRAIAAALVFIAAVGGIIAPWALRNYTVFHQVVLLETKGGVNFWLGNSPNTPGDFIRNVWKSGIREPMLAALPDDELDRDRAAYTLGLSYVTANPIAFIARMPIKFADFWSFERSLTDTAQVLRADKSAGAVIAKAGADLISDAAYAALVLLAIGGFIFASEDRWKVLLGGLVVYFAVVHVVVFGDGRFHLPLIPFMAIYAAWFAAHAGANVRTSFVRAAALISLWIVFAAIMLHEIAAAFSALTAA